MKFLKKYVVLSIAALSITACDFKVLDDHPYYMGDSADQIFTSPEKIAAAAVGMYDALQNAEFLGGRALIYVDIRGIDLNPASYFGNMSTFNPTSSDATNAYAWQGAYRTIYECNLFINGIEGAKAKGIVDEADYKLFTGEAKFIRSTVYFYLLNLWGQSYVAEGESLGVPLVLTPSDGVTAFTDALKIPRSSIADCYTQIIKDLEYAEANLDEDWGNDYANVARATKNAARAMLSRVCLYNKDNANAIAWADKVTGKTLASSTYKNIEDPVKSPENIFFVAMNTTDNPNTNNALGQHYGSARRADITVYPKFAESFSDNDVRKKECLQLKDGNWYCYKYRKTSADWVPVIRYAEVLLNKAEALVKQSNSVSTDAINLLNQVHQRSEAGKTYVAADFANANALLEEILLERRKELAFEGHSSFDLFRNQKGIAAGRGTATAPAIPYPSNYFALPIPNSDIEKAGTDILKQNKGY